MTKKHSSTVRHIERSPPNAQLQQKIVNSNEDDMFQLDSESEMPQAQAAIHELRQLSSRSEKRANQAVGAPHGGKHQHQQSAQIPQLDLKNFIEDQLAQKSFP